MLLASPRTVGSSRRLGPGRGILHELYGLGLLFRGVVQWLATYVRAIDGELRLWVNGEEVSGGTGAQPRTGYLCLESEGSPVEFKNIRVRELP